MRIKIQFSYTSGFFKIYLTHLQYSKRTLSHQTEPFGVVPAVATRGWGCIHPLSAGLVDFHPRWQHVLQLPGIARSAFQYVPARHKNRQTPILKEKPEVLIEIIEKDP